MAINIDHVAGVSHSASLVGEIAPACCSLTSHTAPPRGNDALSNAELKELLIAHSTPAPLPPAWKFLDRSDAIRRLRCPPAELAAGLQKEFPLPRLLSSKILVRTSNQPIRLSPVFGDEHSKFVLLLDKDQALTDVVSARGALISTDPACFRWGLRRRDKGPPKRVYLASSDDDFQVLLQLGFTATTTAGLAEVNAIQAGRLVHAKQFSSVPSYRLTLVGWQVGAVIRDVPPELHRTLQHLWNIEQAFAYDRTLVSFRFWQPSEEQFDRIRSVVALRDCELVRKALMRNIGDSITDAVQAWNTLREETDVDLVTAEMELKRVIGSSYSMANSSEAKAALARFMRAVDRVTLDRFLAWAAESKDPFVSSMLLLAREAWRDCVENQPLVRSAKRVIDNQAPTTMNTSTDSIGELRQLADLLAKIRKVVGPTD